MSVDPRTLEYIGNHLPSIVGWGTVVYACTKFIGFCIRAGRTFALVEKRVLDGEETLKLLATNHIPHVEAAINETNKKVDETNQILRALREDLTR